MVPSIEQNEASLPYVQPESKSESGIDLGKYQRVKSMAESGIPELQDADLHQKVENQITGMLGAMSTDSANALLDLASRHPPETISMIRGFVITVKQSEQQNNLTR